VVVPIRNRDSTRGYYLLSLRDSQSVPLRGRNCFRQFLIGSICFNGSQKKFFKCRARVLESGMVVLLKLSLALGAGFVILSLL